MKEIDDIFLRLDKDNDVDSIRLDIANLIAECLSEKRDALGYWEKECFANSIAYLSHNFSLSYRHTSLWLRSCLLSLEKIYTPPNERCENYTKRNKEIETLTFDQLSDALQKLGGCT